MTLCDFLRKQEKKFPYNSSFCYHVFSSQFSVEKYFSMSIDEHSRKHSVTKTGTKVLWLPRMPATTVSDPEPSENNNFANSSRRSHGQNFRRSEKCRVIRPPVAFQPTSPPPTHHAPQTMKNGNSAIPKTRISSGFLVYCPQPSAFIIVFVVGLLIFSMSRMGLSPSIE